MHETLYHFHEPKNEVEANAWLMQFLRRYNNMQHRLESHSRLEDWLRNIPPSGLREMCGWNRFCTFAREPERRKVGADARVSIDSVDYELDPDLAGEEVILWWGLFDHELYVEHGRQRFGPYNPVGGPIPLHRFRKFKKTKNQRRADRIELLAEKLSLPKAALNDNIQLQFFMEEIEKPLESFSAPDPFQELTFPNKVAAKRAIADHLGLPLAKLNSDQLEVIEAIVTETLTKTEVIQRVSEFLNSSNG
jgi:hypothetical protein